LISGAGDELQGAAGIGRPDPAVVGEINAIASENRTKRDLPELFSAE
jgi:hypothetical protein